MLLPKTTENPLDGFGNSSITKQVDRAHRLFPLGIILEVTRITEKVQSKR
jgi:hypothetical protein